MVVGGRSSGRIVIVLIGGFAMARDRGRMRGRAVRRVGLLVVAVRVSGRSVGRRIVKRGVDVMKEGASDRDRTLAFCVGETPIDTSGVKWHAFIRGQTLPTQ